MSSLSKRTALVSAAMMLLGAAVSAQSSTAKVVSAANAFMATLRPSQRDSLIFAFNDDAQRRRWSNFPSGIFQRAGLPLGRLSETQRAAAMTLLSRVLSKRGYEKTMQIVEADEALKQTEGGRGGRGGALIFGKDLYYISILGTPSDKTPWMLQFGGGSRSAYHYADAKLHAVEIRALTRPRGRTVVACPVRADCSRGRGPG